MPAMGNMPDTIGTVSPPDAARNLYYFKSDGFYIQDTDATEVKIGSYASAAGVFTTLTASGLAEFGVDDTTSGNVYIYGHAAASTAGGELRLYMAADHDTTYEYWTANVLSDDLIIETAGGAIQHVFAPESTTFNAASADVNHIIESNGNANMFYLDGGTDSISIGSSTEIAFFGILGQSDEIQLAARAHSTQTTEILDIQSNAGVTLFSVGTGGVVIDAGIILEEVTKTLTAGGEITISPGDDPWIELRTNAGAGTEALVKINGGVEGQIIYISDRLANEDVTVTHDGAFIRLDGAANFAMDNTQDRLGMMCIAADNWVELFRSNNA